MTYTPLLLLGAPGWLEIVLILVVVLLLFGAKKLPEVMGSFGKGVKEFKKGVRDIGRDIDEDITENDDSGEPPSPTKAEEQTGRGRQSDGEGS